MTPRKFVDEIAVPTVREFMADPTQRRGYLACIAVYHVSDYLRPVGTRRADDVHDAIEADVGRPFIALQRMADAVKHREKTEGKGAGTVTMQSGFDTARPPAGFGSDWSEFRFDDAGGRYIEDGGRRYDMLDLCVIVLRAYAKLYGSDLSGSSIDGIQYNPAAYPKA